MSTVIIIALVAIVALQARAIYKGAHTVRDLRHSLRAREAHIQSLKDALELVKAAPSDSQWDEIQRLRRLCRSVRESYRRRLGRGKYEGTIGIDINWP